MGKLVIIEGTDGSGKQTQSQLLNERLYNEGIKVKKISFPDYDSPSSSLVKMYLNGDFGKDAQSVNAYAASSFYGVDRYASFKTKWAKEYENGYVIISDRYTTSNIVHQASKIDDFEIQREFKEYVSKNISSLDIEKIDCVGQTLSRLSFSNSIFIPFKISKRELGAITLDT